MSNAIDTALEAMRHANPVPDQAELADAMLRSSVFLTTTKETSMSIDTGQPTHETPPHKQSGTRGNLVVLVVAVVAVVGVAVMLASGDGDDSSPASAPADVINDYVAAYNSNDIDAVMAVFTEDSVITGHPTGTGSASGLEEIRALHVGDLRYERGYHIANVETSGNTVTWDTVWGDNYGCVGSHTTVTNGDKIVTWSWGTVFSCPQATRRRGTHNGTYAHLPRRA